MIWLIVVAAAVVLAWPAGVAGRRRLAVGGTTAAPGAAVGRVTVGSVRRRLVELAEAHPRRIVVAAAIVGGLLGGVVGGPVAGLVAGVYRGLGGRAAVRVVASRRDAVARARTLDGLCALAADLRAGLPAVGSGLPAGLAAGSDGLSVDAVGAGSSGAPPPTLGSVSRSAVRAERRIGELVSAVWRMAETTGAPAADLVERIEADARAADRGAASAAAEAAGAQATGLLLAALPLAGIAIGYAIGTDPLHVLLRTPVGAACALAALVLQCAGLLWSERLVNGPAR